MKFLKKIFFLSISITTLNFELETLNCFSQVNQWVWIKGDNIVNQPSVYGDSLIPNINNKPGGRYEASEWTDLQGNFWLFGGSFNINFEYDDLWKYNPATNEWTWMKGSQLTNQPGEYGTKGVSDPANNPPAMHCGATWTDKNGRYLWLFGGMNLNATQFNHLWRYDIITNEWTWMNGTDISNQSGIYGVKGIADPLHTPGARHETTCTWTDANGYLWLFGGDGRDVNNDRGLLNDLWKYDTNTNEWMWVNGENTFEAPANYGIKGVTAASNVPGGRFIYTNWTDINGNFWIFGGRGFDKNGNKGSLNDLWMYEPATDQWTWMNGSSVSYAAGVYTTKCVESAAATPGARSENRAEWTDDCGNFWLFGGGDIFNDAWRYNPSTAAWTWISGASTTNQPGTYGVMGTPNPANVPGARSGSISWRNQDGLWLWGGQTTGAWLSDLWKYIPDKPTAAFTTYSLTGCIPFTVQFSDNSNSNCNKIKSYQWDFGDIASGAANSSTITNPSYEYTSVGNYTVTLIVYDCTGSSDTTSQSFIATTTVVATITGNNIICSGSSINLSASGGSFYLWNNGTTSSVLTATLAGSASYTVIVSNGGICNDRSSIDILVNPFPTITLTGNTSICIGDSTILSAAGGTYYSWNTGATTTSIKIFPTSLTVYTITVTDASGCYKDSSFAITVTAMPVAEAGPNDTICRGETGVLNASGGNYFFWNTSATTSQLMVSPPFTATYTVNVSNGICYDTDTARIIVYANPIVSAGSDVKILSGDSITLSGNGGGTYLWIPAEGLSCTTCQHPIASPDSTTVYCLIITDQNNCTDMACITVTVDLKCGSVYTPTAFSPNGDGRNDLFFLYGNCIKTMIFTIYDRWGEKVFQTNDITSKWDGKYKGKELNTAVFAYYLDAIFVTGEKITRKGNISLIK